MKPPPVATRISQMAVFAFFVLPHAVNSAVVSGVTASKHLLGTITDYSPRPESRPK
jgi:hypothetical protein